MGLCIHNLGLGRYNPLVSSSVKARGPRPQASSCTLPSLIEIEIEIESAREREREDSVHECVRGVRMRMRVRVYVVLCVRACVFLRVTNPSSVLLQVSF